MDITEQYRKISGKIKLHGLSKRAKLQGRSPLCKIENQTGVILLPVRWVRIR